jgi:proline iminopeptidase
MPPIPPPQADGTTTTTAHPLYWCRYASAAPRSRLVVLHGGPGASHDYLLPQMLELSRDRECLFFDQRGGGRSRTDDRTPVTWEVLVEDLTRVVAELAPGPLTLVGYSWGGLLALLYAMEAREGRAGPVPARMVLIDPAPVTRQWRNEFEAEFARRQASPEVSALREELAASGLRERDPDAHRQRAFELSVAGYFADPRKARDLTPFRVTGRVQQEVWQSLGDFDLRLRLRGVRVPALVVHGRQDPIPMVSSMAVANALAAETLWLDGCGHVPYVEQGAALFTGLRFFLDETENLVTA